MTLVTSVQLLPSVPPRSKPTPNKPKPQAPSTTAATAWPLYSLYPPGPEWPYSQHVPVSQEPGKGYDVEHGGISDTRRQAALNQANGQLLDGPGGYTLPLFVQKVGMDMQLTGSYGQSQYTRDFYARNFVQPSVVVTGQSLTQEDYGVLCEFVHSCQHKAVANGYQNLTQLYIVGRNTAQGFQGRGYDGTLRQGSKVVLDQPSNIMPGRQADPANAPSGTYYSQKIRGAHQPLMAKGYISSMPRKHAQFQYVVVWSFVFTIAAMLQGPFRDSAQSLPQQAPTTWLNLLQDIQKTGVISSNTPGLIAKNDQIVKAASAASVNPLTPATAITSGATPTSSGTPASSDGWFTVGATLDPTRGQYPTYDDHSGFSFAELLQAGANAGLHPTLTETLGITSGTYGMPMETPVSVRMPGSPTQFTMYKNDVGSGQAGNAHFKVDLHQGIANALGWQSNQDIQVKIGH